ncbi:MAG: mechanosensitive ion channel family protein [Rhodanobacter sp.]
MVDWLAHTDFAQNSLLAWLYAIGGALLAALLVSGALQIADARLQRRQSRGGQPKWALLTCLLRATRRWLLLLLALVVAGGFLHSAPRVGTLLGDAAFVLCGLQVALWANALVSYWLHRRSDTTGAAVINPVFLTMFTWAAQLLVWVTLLLAFLAHVGVNITAFVASLGVGGIAVALALQNILGDLFSSVAIGLDKPFEVGDFIAFGSSVGTVSQVGVKTTRIASLSGEQLVISNSNLLKELIHNYSRMPTRRIVFGFRVPYGTSRRDVEEIVAQICDFIKAQECVSLDRGHMTAFGEYGFDFEFVYYVLSADFALYRDIQQRMNLAIMELLERMDVPFAVPVREILPRAAALPSALPRAVQEP